MKYFSMFSGIGGFELGIGKRAICIGYSEIDKYAIATYQKHFPTHKNYGNARDINPQELPDFDMLCGGFPCQSFSIAGKRKGFQDTRGTLFYEICRVLEAKKPRLCFLENVKGLLSADDGRCFATILTYLDELGYNVEWEVLNSKNFGVPQNRERVFIIGHLRGESTRQVFPIGQNNKILNKELREERQTANCITARNPMRSIHESTLIQSHSPRCGNPQKGGTGALRSEDFCFTVDTTPHYLIPRIDNLHHHRTGEYGDGVHYDLTPTLDSGCGRDLALNKIRRLTPIECERLQGFPDNWTIGSDTQRYKQCGNAVTVNVIEAIAERLIK